MCHYPLPETFCHIVIMRTDYIWKITIWFQNLVLFFVRYFRQMKEWNRLLSLILLCTLLTLCEIAWMLVVCALLLTACFSADIFCFLNIYVWFTKLTTLSRNFAQSISHKEGTGFLKTVTLQRFGFICTQNIGNLAKTDEHRVVLCLALSWCFF